MALLLDPALPGQLGRAVEMLRAGLPVGLPTETVYGLAATARDEQALARVFALKARPSFDPLIVHVLGVEDAEPLVDEMSDLHRSLMAKFWPGPLTLLFRKSARVPDLCTSGSPWVALRAPSHPVFRQVLEALGAPLAAPSANRFASLSPTSALDVVQELGPYGLEAVLDGGPCEVGVESTVLKLLGSDEAEIVRPGAFSRERLEAEFPSLRLSLRASGSGMVDAPGQSKVHYAPRTPLSFFETLDEARAQLAREDAPGSALFELLQGDASELGDWPWAAKRTLSAKMSTLEAASRLFAELRALDKEGHRRIVAVATSPRELGLALNDRLRRAGARAGGMNT
jgi:L-threonylcarbamoyladenylate synthase